MRLSHRAMLGAKKKILSYYGTATPLSQYRNGLMAESIGNYAVFAGGVYNDDESTIRVTTVDAYSLSLVRTSPTSLSVPFYGGASTAVGSAYAIFGGGWGEFGGYNSIANAYDTSLVRSTPAGCNSGDCVGASVGNYGLIGGGVYSSAVVAYDTSLVRTTAPSLIRGVRSHGSASVGNYALFAGGHYSYDGDFPTVNNVDAYDTSLVKTTPTVLTQARAYLSGSSVGNYALFAGGGTTGYTNYDTVNAYNTSLVRSTPTVLSEGRRDPVGISIKNEYALFGGGYVNLSMGGHTSSALDIYDKTLTRTLMALESAINGHAGASIGDYALFAGGSSDTVYVYQYK